MPGIAVWLLLGLVLLPILGAIAARLLRARLGLRPSRIVATASLAGAIGCLAALQWSPLDTAALGRMRIFLPSRDVVIASNAVVDLPTAAPTSPAATAAPSPTATLPPTAAPTPSATATAGPTATPTPTLEPTPEPTAVPTEAPPTPTEAPPPPTEAPPAPTAAPTQPPSSQPRRYIVESGDTLRGIAEQFGVSVEELLRYNGLTPEEGDSLSVGQELFIPPQ